MQRHRCLPLVWLGPLSDMDEERASRACVLLLKRRERQTGCGCCSCDFHEATVLFFRPGTPRADLARFKAKEGLCLCFCGDWFDCSLQEQHVRIADYAMFDFSVKESLHVSRKELEVLQHGLDGVRRELDWGVDGYSNLLLAERVKLLLDCCLRFYERQFFIRSDVNSHIVAQVQAAVDQYLLTECSRIGGEKFFIDGLARIQNMSTAYLNALVKHETGKSLSLYMRLRRACLLKDVGC